MSYVTVGRLYVPFKDMYVENGRSAWDKSRAVNLKSNHFGFYEDGDRIVEYCFYIKNIEIKGDCFIFNVDKDESYDDLKYYNLRLKSLSLKFKFNKIDRGKVIDIANNLNKNEVVKISFYIKPIPNHQITFLDDCNDIYYKYKFTLVEKKINILNGVLGFFIPLKSNFIIEEKTLGH